MVNPRPRIAFEKFEFHPVIRLPKDYEIYDFSAGYDPERLRHSEYGVGKYNEKRKAMYTSPLFGSPGEQRDIHIGIDIAAPIGTPVHAFYEGELFLQGYNAAEGDYGATIITLHRFEGVELYALFDHLSRRSIEMRKVGDPIKAGEVLAWIGDRNENGGWNPHLHFQLSYVMPETHDMPGVVSERQLKAALETYPDPRLVLGRLY